MFVLLAQFALCQDENVSQNLIDPEEKKSEHDVKNKFEDGLGDFKYEYAP